jgi:bifunctional ADP-heptose synthase (sugar kinase/adenylyltransferase)
MESKPGMASNVYENLKALGCSVTAIYGQKSEKCRLIDTKSGQQIVRIDNDVFSDVIDLEKIDYNFPYDAIVISDYAKGFLNYEAIIELRKRFKQPIFIDTKKKDLQHFNGCFVKINEDEYSKAISVCDDLIVTLGDKGARLYDTTYPPKKVEVVDVCGCGDTFLSALTYKYLDTQSIGAAIIFANKASSVTVQHRGVYAPKLKEIL